MSFRPNDPVKLVSVDTVPRTTEYNGEHYLVEPGETVYWPWKVAAYLLADPFAENDAGYDHGDYEQTRLWIKYGVFSDNPSTEEWDAARPKVECFTMDGDRVYMLGESKKNQLKFTKGLTSDDLKTKVAELERQISQLTASLSEDTPFVVTEQAPGEETIPDLTQLPEDTGTPRKSGQTRR